ncbi:MAG: lecithin retinol acyltransferase family protein [Clostridia bacterium]|nr:lecithin retinol acyltransferase family protein [Clostridia bacterium]
MKWLYAEPSYGDMVRVAVGGIYHFGIYVSDEEVIQFGLPPSRRSGLSDSDMRVLSSDIDAFLAGGFLEVCEFDKKEKKKNRSKEQIVAYARAKLGTGGYHILYNNCEHFANECVTGEQICRQTEDLRAALRALPVADVYIAALPENASIGDTACKARRAELAAISNEAVKREKYFVWKLLCYALERSFGRRAAKCEFKKERYGGWSAGEYEISLSHSDGALAVAVSRAPIGIDIERVHTPRGEKMAQRILNEQELAAYESTSPEKKEERLIELWTAKEALFKAKHIEHFIPSQTDTVGASFKTDFIDIKGKRYVWSVATQTPEKVRVYTNVDLENQK